MNRPISLGLILLVALTTAPGCAIDKTRRSVTFTMQEEIDSSKERAREIEKDLGHERARLDAIEERTTSAGKRLEAALRDVKKHEEVADLVAVMFESGFCTSEAQGDPNEWIIFAESAIAELKVL